MGDGANNARHNFLVSKVPWICQHRLIKLPGLNSVHLVCDDMSSQTRKCAIISQHHHVTKNGVSKCTDSIRDAGARCCCIKVEGHSPIQKTTICKNAAAIFWRNIGKGAEVPNRGVSADFSKGGMSLVWVWWVWGAWRGCGSLSASAWQQHFFLVGWYRVDPVKIVNKQWIHSAKLRWSPCFCNQPVFFLSIHVTLT